MIQFVICLSACEESENSVRNYQQRASGQKIIKSTYIRTHTQIRERINVWILPGRSKRRRPSRSHPLLPPPVPCHSETETERRYRPSARNETRRQKINSRFVFPVLNRVSIVNRNTQSTHTPRGRKIENFQQRSAQFASDLVWYFPISPLSRRGSSCCFSTKRDSKKKTCKNTVTQGQSKYY